MPNKATVLRWLAKDAAYLSRYLIARQLQAGVWADEIADLARSEPPRNPRTGYVDRVAMQHIRNRVGTLRWLAEKFIPKCIRATGPGAGLAEVRSGLLDGLD